ncbi:MAG: galactitol-1-phosphate 5-dehydrogenase [Eubacteriales bacterium]|nr:galactitol-1-phosphate 5-dehydrogenase [Eubacteriales bacterium]MDD3197918.1 galactitol-1-phosphate 5-dehydrogenase [Eubacteriales bacterium]MDD3503102.1 galactitol-1-phosphate 5-dehydrogenase [Eubacteriales bacterium]MDD4683417.1 galactitol-1-phosphate 5-dehydrogenase [Eubacteriales bacterium]
MKAGVLYAKDDIRYADWPDFTPGAGMVKVRMRVCGICGSDLPRVLGDAAHFYPVILGHEFAGEVVEVGEGVETIKVGDRVAGAPLMPCLKCEDCQKGNYALCRHYGFVGSRQPGAFAEYVELPERNAIVFNENVTFEQGALFEPATVALHGLFQADFRGATDVAVLGGGNIGILAMQWANILGARSVTVFDIDDDRLALASRLGAANTINTKDSDYLEQAMALTNGRGFDFVFETAGQPVTIKMGFDLTAGKGTFCCIGTPTRPVEFSAELWEKMNRREFKVTGSWMSYSAPFPGREWTLTAHYFGTGELRLEDSMVFKRMPLANIADAFDMYRIPGAVKGKILLTND